MLSIMVALVCIGCNTKTHKDYAFSKPVFHLSTGSIHAKLRGVMLNVDHVTSVHKGPYEMLLWFKLNGAPSVGGCLVSLSEMVLKNTETGDLVSIPKIATAAFRQRSDGAIVASISVKNLNLLYSDHEMQFFYSFNDDCGFLESSSSVTMKFLKDYSERNISFMNN